MRRIFPARGERPQAAGSQDGCKSWRRPASFPIRATASLNPLISYQFMQKWPINSRGIRRSDGRHRPVLAGATSHGAGVVPATTLNYGDLPH